MSHEIQTLHQPPAVGREVALIGQVVRVTNTSVVIKGPSGPSGELALTEQTQVCAQVPGTPSDIAVGLPVMVVSISIGPSPQVVEVQIGGDQSFIPPGQGGTPAADNRAVKILSKGAGGGPVPPGPSFLAGVVAEISGRSLVVRCTGTENIRLTLSERPMIQKFVPASADQIQAGKIVRAWCAEATSQLTRLYILNPPAMPR